MGRNAPLPPFQEQQAFCPNSGCGGGRDGRLGGDAQLLQSGETCGVRFRVSLMRKHFAVWLLGVLSIPGSKYIVRLVFVILTIHFKMRVC